MLMMDCYVMQIMMKIKFQTSLLVMLLAFQI